MIGATIHQIAISPITARSRVPVASPSPAMAPTAVIDVDAGTPAKLPTKSAPPIKKRTTMLVSSVNTFPPVTRSSPSVVTTRWPNVPAPMKKNTDISAAAPDLESTSAPTAGPNAGPVVAPPMLYPTNAATTNPTRSKASTIYLL